MATQINNGESGLSVRAKLNTNLEQTENSAGSHITSGTGVSINGADNTTFDIDIQGVIKDNGVFYDIDVQQTGVAVPDKTGNVTYILINKDGTIIQQKTPATEAQLYNHLGEFIVVHADNTTLNAVNNYILKSDNIVNQLQGLGRNIGFINQDGGNEYSPNGANLQINKSAGSVFYFGIADDNTAEQPAQTALSFRIRNQNGDETANTTSLDVANYDVGGVTTALPSGTNIYATYRIFLFAGSNTTVLQRPQFTYTTLDEAINGINSENYILEENLRTNAVFRGYIVFRKATTALNNEAQNQFIKPTGLGLSGGVVFTPNAQAVYNVSSPTAEVETNADNGSWDFKEGTGVDTADVTSVKNNAGNKTFRVTGEGRAFSGTTYQAPTSDNELVGKKYVDDSITIESDPTGVTGADQITNMMSLTTAEYNAITPNASTLYVITDA